MPRPGASIKTILRVPSARSWETGPMARMADLDELALAMPQTTKELSEDGRPSHHVHGKLFCFHRGPRRDAADPDPGERLEAVLKVRVSDLGHNVLLHADQVW